MKDFSRRYDISIQSVEAHITKHTRKNETVKKRREENSERRNFEKRTGGRRDLDGMQLYNAEQLLLNLACEKEVYNLVKDELLPENFSEGIHRRLAEIIFGIHKDGGKVNPAFVLSQFSPEEVPEAAKILSDDRNVDDRKRAATEALKIIKKIIDKKTGQELAQSGDLDSLKKMIEKLKKDKS